MGWTAPLHRLRYAKADVRVVVQPEEPTVLNVTKIGSDLAKNVFQI